MRMDRKELVKRLIPQSMGGRHENIYNVAVSWLKISPELKSLFLNCFLKHPSDWPSKLIEPNHAPLWHWIGKHEPSKILEIGLGTGANARKMIDLAGGCTYFCFDDISAADVKSHEGLRRMPDTRFYIGDTMETLPRVIKSLPKMDLIFIDGAHDHEHVKNDWEHCKRLMHSSTACFFHDYDM